MFNPCRKKKKNNNRGKRQALIFAFAILVFVRIKQKDVMMPAVSRRTGYKVERQTDSVSMTDHLAAKEPRPSPDSGDSLLNGCLEFRFCFLLQGKRKRGGNTATICYCGSAHTHNAAPQWLQQIYIYIKN